MVNVLDVPVQGNLLFEGSRNVSSSSLDSAVFTLDPKDKYLPPGVRRATTTSAIHARKVRLSAIIRPNARAPRNSSSRAVGAPQTSKTTQAPLVLERQRSLLSVFHRMRQTRSAGSNTNSNFVWPRKIFSRAGQLTKQHIPDPLQELAKLYNRAPSLPPTRIGDEFEMPIQIPSTAGNTDRAPTALKINPSRLENTVSPLEQLSYSDSSQSALPNDKEQGFEDAHATSSVRNFENSFLSSYDAPPEQLKDTLPYFTSTPADKTTSNENPDRLDLAPDPEETSTDPTKMPLDEQTINSNGALLTQTLGSLELDVHSPKYGYAESLASYATSANFSPCLASNTTHSGPMSPYHLSQPETPIMSEFGDEFLPPLRDPESLAQMGRSTSSDPDLLPARPSSKTGPQNLPWPLQDDTDATLGGFQGYTLPDHDHASVLTIRKLPSITFKKTDGTSGFPQDGSKKDLVHSWNDGSEHRMAALGELVDFDDLGYLAEMIN